MLGSVSSISIQKPSFLDCDELSIFSYIPTSDMFFPSHLTCSFPLESKKVGAAFVLARATLDICIYIYMFFNLDFGFLSSVTNVCEVS